MLTELRVGLVLITGFFVYPVLAAVANPLPRQAVLSLSREPSEPERSKTVAGEPLDRREAYRLSMENDAKLIESVAAHLDGVAQLQRVIVEDLNWRSVENKQRQHVQDAVKSFKNSQVLLSEALANTTLLVSRVDREAREQLSMQLAELRERTGDLCAKNSAIIKSLEAQQLPGTQSLQDLTRSMMAVIGFGIEVAQQKAKTPHRH